MMERFMKLEVCGRSEDITEAADYLTEKYEVTLTSPIPDTGSTPTNFGNEYPKYIFFILLKRP